MAIQDRMHRTLGRANKQALGITAQTIEKMILATKNDLRGIRDKALIPLAYDSLCRRGKLVSIRIDDIEHDNTGMPTRICLRRSKTDQEAIGRLIRINTKTQQAIKYWIDCSKINDGFLFRGIKNNGYKSENLSPGQINRIYKRMALAANIPIDQIKNISGHSIRADAAQNLVNSGVILPALMNRGRWSKPETAMRYAESLDTSKI